MALYQFFILILNNSRVAYWQSSCAWGAWPRGSPYLRRSRAVPESAACVRIKGQQRTCVLTAIFTRSVYYYH